MKKLPPDKLPFWPARMGLPLAAAYVDESPSMFLLNVKARKWPAARKGHGGRKLSRRMYWFRDELDAALARDRRDVQSMSPDDISRVLLGARNDRPAA